jgi:hypothetical protein
MKGMAVYSVIWPTSSIVQQIIAKDKLDWKKTLRFFLFGTFFVGMCEVRLRHIAYKFEMDSQIMFVVKPENLNFRTLKSLKN